MEKSKQDYIFECENGKVYGIPKDTKCCLICKHCKDIWYDYTNGPYMWFCSLNEDTNECMNCNSFELEEGTMTVEEYQKHLERQIEIQKEINKILDEAFKNNEKEIQENFIKTFLQTIPKNMIKLPKNIFKKLK